MKKFKEYKALKHKQVKFTLKKEGVGQKPALIHQ
jgi:hypothetical protein